MTELFSDISQFSREAAEFIADMAFSKKDPIIAAKMLDKYVASLDDEREKEFAQFYFKLRMEQLK